MNVRSQRLGVVVICAAIIAITVYSVLPASVIAPAGRVIRTLHVASGKSLPGTQLSPAFSTDIDLRGPTGGATPADFEYDVATVIHHIERYSAGEHLSTAEMCYVLQAYEQEYRYRMKHPRTMTPLLAFATDPGKPQLARFFHIYSLSE